MNRFTAFALSRIQGGPRTNGRAGGLTQDGRAHEQVSPPAHGPARGRHREHLLASARAPRRGQCPAGAPRPHGDRLLGQPQQGVRRRRLHREHRGLPRRRRPAGRVPGRGRQPRPRRPRPLRRGEPFGRDRRRLRQRPGPARRGRPRLPLLRRRAHGAAGARPRHRHRRAHGPRRGRAAGGRHPRARGREEPDLLRPHAPAAPARDLRRVHGHHRGARVGGLFRPARRPYERQRRGRRGRARTDGAAARLAAGEEEDETRRARKGHRGPRRHAGPPGWHRGHPHLRRRSRQRPPQRGLRHDAAREQPGQRPDAPRGRADGRARHLLRRRHRARRRCHRAGARQRHPAHGLARRGLRDLRPDLPLPRRRAGAGRERRRRERRRGAPQRETGGRGARDGG